MPSVVRSRSWFTQVDGPLEFVQQKLALLGVELETAIAVYHVGKNGDNPHFHLCSTMSKELQKQSWDTKIKKMFNVSGAQYSSKPWDENLDSEGAGTYLFHEDPANAPILLCKNVPSDTIAKLKEIASVVNVAVAQSKEKAETKIPGKVIAKWADAGYPQWRNQDIVRIICTMAHNGECYLPKTDWQWKAYIEEIHLKMCHNAEQLDTFVNRTFDRLFSRY